MAITQIKGSNIEDGTVLAADIKDDSITNAKIKSDASIDASKLGTIPASKLEGTLDLSSKTVTLPAASVTAHATTPTLDSPVITGTLAVLDSGTVTHTIANWSDDLSYTITPTNCTAGAVNASGQFVITHTSGSPSYTIKATTASLGLADSALVTKNIVMQLSAPTLSSPADNQPSTDVVYTITSTTTFDDKLVLDIGSSNFTFQSVSVGTASKVGNTVECIGFTTNNPAVTIQFTVAATYSVTAKSVNIAGTYGTSANSSADSITIAEVSAATGGTVTTDGDYKIHTFTTTSNLVFSSSGTDIEWLVVAGGGGGGGGRSNSSYGGAGGGAGGYRTATGQAVTNTTYTVTVGGGGAAGVNDTTNPDNAVASSIIGTGVSLSSSGGGGGATRQRGLPSGGEGNNNGHPGGSGGGGTSNNVGEGGTGGAGNEGSYSPVEGYAGSVGGPNGGTGGGGGASEIPTTSATTKGGVGGNGIANDIGGTTVIPGSGDWFALTPADLGSYTITAGGADSTTGDNSIRSHWTTGTGDFTVQATITAHDNQVFGVYPVSEDDSFASNDSGGMDSMTNAWWWMGSGANSNKARYTGSNQYTFSGSDEIEDGSVVQIKRVSGVISWWIDGTSRHTYSQTSSADLRVNIAHHGTTNGNIQSMSFTNAAGPVYSGGGAGGGTYAATVLALGGNGGGGQGGAGTGVDGSHGAPNSGGGGGGASSSYPSGPADGGQGGSGVVIVKYKYQ